MKKKNKPALTFKNKICIKGGVPMGLALKMNYTKQFPKIREKNEKIMSKGKMSEKLNTARIPNYKRKSKWMIFDD